MFKNEFQVRISVWRGVYHQRWITFKTNWSVSCDIAVTCNFKWLVYPQWLPTICQATLSSLWRRWEVIQLEDGKSDQWSQRCCFRLFSPSKRNSKSQNSYTSKNATFIVECPMIDHVRWPITHFVGHPLNHVDDVMRCFCSIFNYWSLVARVVTCGIFLLKSNDVQTRNFWEGHFLCAFTYIPSIALAW